METQEDGTETKFPCPHQLVSKFGQRCTKIFSLSYLLTSLTPSSFSQTTRLLNDSRWITPSNWLAENAAGRSLSILTELRILLKFGPQTLLGRPDTIRHQSGVHTINTLPSALHFIHRHHSVDTVSRGNRPKSSTGADALFHMALHCFSLWGFWSLFTVCCSMMQGMVVLISSPKSVLAMRLRGDQLFLMLQCSEANILLLVWHEATNSISVLPLAEIYQNKSLLWQVHHAQTVCLGWWDWL